MLNTKRHQSIFNPNLFGLPVHIVGCGGMGSHLAAALVRMGVGRVHSPISLYDFDTYEPHNLTNQYITTASVGKKKVQGLATQLRRIEPNVNLKLYETEVDLGDTFDGVVLLCLDTMTARREIVDWSLENNEQVSCVIETRMDAEVGISHCFDPNNTKHQDCWWMYWHSDQEAENTAGCGGPQSIISAIYGTSMLALKQFEKFARYKTPLLQPNRVYQEFDAGHVNFEIWPT